ncbi:MAG TPA: redoxin domain-containing protein [Acidimicrobiia bacterium]|nr:redoxin domain-containing protein [Acidimicrobiia bacterium]
MLTTGAVAPGFTVPDQDGSPTSLTDEHGHWVLLWWYPMADTPG